MDIDFAQLEKHGFAIVPGVLSVEAVDETRRRLWAAAEESERRGAPTFVEGLDPNACNVRIFNLLDLDPLFVDLIQHPLALEAVQEVIGREFLISNFTANIARPGSQSMVAHSDLAVVFPGPWTSPWSMNVIWCLDDVYEQNGATRYLPGSHRIEHRQDLPDNFVEQMLPFEASAGDVILMEGRLWHTSGANITQNHDRALLFGYYTAPFLRPQVNWNVLLSDATVAALSEDMHHWLGLGPAANVANADLVARPTR